MQKGQCLNITQFSVGGDEVSSLQNNLVKSLGRIIDRSQTNRKSKDELLTEVENGSKAIDKSVFTWGMKLFTCQNICCPEYVGL